jgi:LAO/AO transport system kinase
MGDDIQAIKAGILEVADIFVINKADREGVEKTTHDIQMMLDMNSQQDRKASWRPPIVATEAVNNKGIPQLLSEIEAHKSYLFGHSKKHFNERLKNKAVRDLLDTVKDRVVTEIMKELERSHTFDTMVNDLVEKKTDPFTLCDQIMTEKFKISP